MKKYLLPARGKFYKANLHCHSTCSDGKLTPEELKELYTSHGYSIIAYTDHDVLISHDELTDGGFLALHGFETETTDPKTGKTCHLCYIGIKKDQLTQPNWHRSAYLFGGAPALRDRVKFDETKPDFVREYTKENINLMIKNAREAGYFITYNHPTWSLEDFNDYTAYEGMHAMEIVNYGCIAESYDDYNPREYDDMLRSGKRIFCIATDDNHNHRPQSDPRYDSFGGFTMIKAPSLDYETITAALVKGNFYASQGPLIKALWIEDGVVHIKTSAAVRIEYTTAVRRCEGEFAEPGKSVTEAQFKVYPGDIFFRITVTDKHGLHANTSAYFTDKLGIE